jgi:hypothetical protein
MDRFASFYFCGGGTVRLLTRIGFAMLALLSCYPVFAQSGGTPPADHKNVQEGLPLEIDDATPIERGLWQLQSVLRYVRTADRTDEWIMVPRLNIGVAPNWEALLSGQFLAGSGDRRNSGDTRLDMLYNFQQETDRLPALGVSLQTDFPTGKESKGIDTVLEVKATRTLASATTQPELHLNLGWKHNDKPLSGEYRDGYRAVVGYSRAIGPHASLLLDVVSEEELREGRHQHLAEVGWRQQSGRRAVLSVGVGAGLDRHSPHLRLTGGVQVAL